MPLNISTLDEAQSLGQGKFNRWYRTFNDQWNAPIHEANIALAMDLPEPMLRELEQMAPDAMKQIRDKYLP